MDVDLTVLAAQTLPEDTLKLQRGSGEGDGGGGGGGGERREGRET